MTKRLPNLFTFGIESIKQKIDNIISLGYDREAVIKITRKFPAIFGYSMDSLKNKFSELVSLGYSPEEMIDMSKNFPELFCLKKENLEQRLESIIDLGYTKEEAHHMTISLPTLLGYTKESLEKKVRFYDSIGLHDMAVETPKNLMQSVELSYARYQLYASEGIQIDMSNYGKLFVKNKQFMNKYEISKEELIDTYNYDRDNKENTNGRTI